MLSTSAMFKILHGIFGAGAATRRFEQLVGVESNKGQKRKTIKRSNAAAFKRAATKRNNIRKHK